MNIILIGFMGCGKSTVGKLLAKELKLSFVDSDSLIEEKENKKISAIFKENGEARFRNIETRVLAELKDSDGIVLSTGGGIILKEENVSLLKKMGPIILLWADPEVIYDRIKYDKQRPLLQVNDPKAEIEKILEFRKTYYYSAAEKVFDTTEIDQKEVAEEIIEWLRSK
ncbi:MAG: shikimate kinase [Candidatus Margulisiibacteriota bacterium]